MIVLQGHAQLPEIVLAMGAPGRFAGRLDGRQEQADQDADDGDHHQQFDQGETRSADSTVDAWS